MAVLLKPIRKLAAGVRFARVARYIALSRLNMKAPEFFAETLYKDDEAVNAVFKAAVAAGSTLTGNWATNLVGDETGIFADFAEFLRPQTIVGRFGNGGIPSLRVVPFRVPLISQTGKMSGYWVGEGKPKPVTAANFAHHADAAQGREHRGCDHGAAARLLAVGGNAAAR